MSAIALCLLAIASVPAQTQALDTQKLPSVAKFVAPAYPQAAIDQRMGGTIISRLRVARDGSVVSVRTVSVHADDPVFEKVFEKFVIDALKQWRFKPWNGEFTIDVSSSFEFIEDECEGANAHPITSEIHVSADLPAFVYVSTGVECVETTNETSRP